MYSTLKIALVIVCIQTASSSIYGQQSISPENLSAMNQFIDGYNNRDYKLMREPLSGIMRSLLTEKRLEQAYGTNYLHFGKATVRNLRSNSENSIQFDIIYEKDTTEKYQMGLAFTKKNKIIGINAKNPNFRYPTKAVQNPLPTAVIHAKIDSMLNLKFSSGVFNGCVMVIDSGKVIYKNCAGYSNMDNKTPLNENSVFELASCSKQFTATATLMLADKGKLNIKDDITLFFPELPYKGVTVEHLLLHTSGLPDYMEVLDKYWDKSKVATNKDVIDYLIKYKPKKYFKPGKKFEYSNTGYVLLSSIIEKVSGVSFNEFMDTKIFGPLGMNNTRVYNTRRSDRETIPNYAFGYVYSDSLKKYVLPDSLPDYNYVYFLDGITGDGTINSTISDLVIWENSLRTDRLLPKTLLDKAFENATTEKGEKTDYGYGWSVNQNKGEHYVVHHSGSWPGYITFILHFVDQEKSVVILTNNEYLNAGKFVDKIALLLVR